MSTKWVYVANPHLRQYGGEEYEIGEVFRMRNLPNDLKLLAYHYVVEIEPGQKVARCTPCGKRFVDLSRRDAHARAAIANGHHTVIDISRPQAPYGRARIGDFDPEGDKPLPIDHDGAEPLDPLAPLMPNSRVTRTAKGIREVVRL